MKIADVLPKRIGVISLANQLARSGTSPALNYGEAQAAESPKDFLHKLRTCLKELRETQICLKILRCHQSVDIELIDPPLNECGQLVAIFTKSIETKTKNMRETKVKRQNTGA